ncbi:MAG: hypothetical protein ACPG4T_13020, partial [Nannocystaceae bacterium]
SLLLRIEVLRINSHELRARSGIAALSRSTLPARLRRRIERAVHRDLAVLTRTDLAWVRPQVAALRSGLSALAGDRDSACVQMRMAAASFELANMHGWAACAKHQLGRMLETPEATSLQDAAGEELREQGVQAPERFANTLVPMVEIQD